MFKVGDVVQLADLRKNRSVTLPPVGSTGVVERVSASSSNDMYLLVKWQVRHQYVSQTLFADRFIEPGGPW